MLDDAQDGGRNHGEDDDDHHLTDRRQLHPELDEGVDGVRSLLFLRQQQADNQQDRSDDDTPTNPVHLHLPSGDNEELDDGRDVGQSNDTSKIESICLASQSSSVHEFLDVLD